jgi:cytoskeletal protein RodZ
MTSVGERLSRERMRQGIDLAALARATRIQPKHLQAIEAGRIEDLPGAFFYRSFVRQYAAALHMDASEFEAELEPVRAASADALDAALRQVASQPRAMDPIPTISSRRSTSSERLWKPIALLAVVTFVCTLVYGWWIARVERQDFASNPAGAALLAANRATADTPAPPPRIPQTAARAAQAQIIPVAAPRLATAAGNSASDRLVVVNLAAKGEVWVSASAEGRRLYAGLLEPSDSKVLTSDTQFRMRIGNAGGLEITWNGKSLGTLGSDGQVRDVVFTADNYHVLSPGDSL